MRSNVGFVATVVSQKENSIFLIYLDCELFFAYALRRVLVEQDIADSRVAAENKSDPGIDRFMVCCNSKKGQYLWEGRRCDVLFLSMIVIHVFSECRIVVCCVGLQFAFDEEICVMLIA